jgi:transposase-like protein
LIDEIVREGARRMLAEALQAEVDAYIARFVAERDENGHRLVVRNGSHQPREVLTSAGAVEVTAPRVNDRRVDPETGEQARFTSAILPAWCRKTPKITEVLPLLYLHGLSTGDFVPALGQFLGSSAGLSAAVITKLTEAWKAEQRSFPARDLSGVDYVYLWVDGIHVNIRPPQISTPAVTEPCRPSPSSRTRPKSHEAQQAKCSRPCARKLTLPGLVSETPNARHRR